MVFKRAVYVSLVNMLSIEDYMDFYLMRFKVRRVIIAFGERGISRLSIMVVF